MRAVVLGRRNFREYDQVVSLYSRSHGKLEVLAKGAKKIVSKNAAHLEPSCVVDVGIVSGAEIDRLTSVQCVSHFSHMRDRERTIRFAALVLHTIDRIIKPNEPDHRLFDLLEDWLVQLNRSEHTHPGVVDLFFLEVLALLGFDPQPHIPASVSDWSYKRLHDFTLRFMQTQLEIAIPDWARGDMAVAL